MPVVRRAGHQAAVYGHDQVAEGTPGRGDGCRLRCDIVQDVQLALLVRDLPTLGASRPPAALRVVKIVRPQHNIRHRVALALVVDQLGIGRILDKDAPIVLGALVQPGDAGRAVQEADAHLGITIA